MGFGLWGTFQVAENQVRRFVVGCGYLGSRVARAWVAG